MIYIPPGVINNASKGAYRKKYKQSDDALMKELLARFGGEMRKTTLVTHHGEIEFHLRFDANEGAYQLIVPCRLAARFSIKRKGRLERGMASFVPAWSIRSHDPRFDEAYSIHTRDLRVTEDVVCQRPVRDAVNKLMARQARGIHLEAEWVRATGSRRSLGKHIDIDNLLVMVEEVAVIAKAVSHWAKSHEIRPAPKGDRAVLTIAVVLTVVALTGIAMMVVGGGNYPLVNGVAFLPYALAASCAALLFAIVPIVVGLSHRTSPYVLVFSFCIFALMAVTLFVGSSMLLGNGLFDDGPRTVYVEPICCKRWTQNKKEKKNNKARYFAGYTTERSANGMVWLRVPKPTYDSIEEERHGMVVTTAAGAFGFPWLVGYRVVDDWQNHTQ